MKLSLGPVLAQAGVLQQRVPFQPPVVVVQQPKHLGTACRNGLGYGTMRHRILADTIAERPMLSDSAREGPRLQPGRDGRVRGSAWSGVVRFADDDCACDKIMDTAALRMKQYGNTLQKCPAKTEVSDDGIDLAGHGVVLV